MQTANDFARAAQQIGRIAVEMKPSDTDPYAEARKLIQYHLQSAAAKAQQIAEALAKTQSTPQ